MKPSLLLLILIVCGVLASLWLQPGEPKNQTSISAGTLLDGMGLGMESESEILKGQIEYLEGQVQVLRDDNERLRRRIAVLEGNAGWQDGTSSAPNGLPIGEVDGLCVDLVQERELKQVPLITEALPGREIEAAILSWLRSQLPADAGLRLGRAIHSLGWVEEAIDPLPLRAALLFRQLGAWYDIERDVLLVDDGSGGEMRDAGGGELHRSALGVAWAHLLRQYGDRLFASDSRAQRLNWDESLAREAMLAGDAVLLRFLHSLSQPALRDPKEIPTEDPDHPLNAIPMPQFFRQLHFFPFVEGFEFVRGLHGMGGWEQVNASYGRLPKNTAELLSMDRYLAEKDANPVPVEWADLTVAGQQPFWDEVLGQYALLTALRAFNEEEVAQLAASGWVGDRLLSYDAGADPGERGSAVWQTLWQDADWAEAFHRAMGNCLNQFYANQETWQEGSTLKLTLEDRWILLKRNREGTGVLLIDAASADFFEEATQKFE